MTKTARFREADLTRAIRALFGRVLRTGLLGKARALLHGLGPKGEYPLREILPCPFCGRTPVSAWHFGWDYTHSWSNPTPLWCVQHNCAAGHGNSEAEAIADWNARA